MNIYKKIFSKLWKIELMLEKINIYLFKNSYLNIILNYLPMDF